MALTVLEATKLDIFKNFRLVAGHRGLDKPVEKVGILDWEFVKKIEGEPVESDFTRGEFVLTSLLFAKDRPELIVEAVKYLEESHVSGLAIKNIYYDELPCEVIDYANEKSLPVFIFGTDVYFEDIITKVMDKVRSIGNYELLESKIDILIKMSRNKAIVRDMALEINSSFKECGFAVYIREKGFFSDDNAISTIEKLKVSGIVGLYDAAIKYQNGILYISTSEKPDRENFRHKTDSILKSLGGDLSKYYIGISNPHISIGDLGRGISESIFAERSGEMSSISVNYFSTIGVYGILFPHANDIWIRNFYNSIVNPIQSHDAKYNTELFTTAAKYVENDGSVSETAKALFLHKNTIRYRIGKIKELLQMEGCELSFNEQISIAIKLHNIYNT